MLRRSHVTRQIEGGIDERHVREGLEILEEMLSASRPGDEADDGHEQRGPDDRPKDREARATDAHREELGQAEEASQPQAHEGADETEGDGNQATAA